MEGEMKSIGDILREQIEEHRRLRTHESAILAFYASPSSLPPKKEPVSVARKPKAIIGPEDCLTTNTPPRILEQERSL
jgi:hypothetical protein